MKLILTILQYLLVINLLAAQAPFELVPFATGLNLPIDIVHAGSGTLYVAEKEGRIRIVNPDGNLGGIFLDITNKIPNSNGERGLLGLVFHPGYPDSAYIFVNYTGTAGATTISRFNVTSPSEADPSSEKILLTIPQPFANHNGGDMVFGPDEYLYIAVGDGGSGGDPQNNAQNLNSLLGKILRIDVKSGDPYVIPPDNPYVGNGDALDEIWAYGVRNPWRIFYDGVSGLYFGDVGQNAWEEVSFIPEAGLTDPNYGWRCYEATHEFNLSQCDELGTFIPPIFEYPHTDAESCSGSITGGVVYRGSNIPQLYGKYIYTDYCTGQIGSIDVDNDNEQEDLLDFNDFQIVTFGLDVTGELYLAAIGQGILYKFCPVNTHFIFALDLDGDQAGTASGALGSGVGIYKCNISELCISGSFSGLSSNSSSGHVHEGDPGIMGDELFELTLNPESETSGSFYGCEILTNTQEMTLRNDGLYVDIHTISFPNGEIRGQILEKDCSDQYHLTAPLIPSGIYHASDIITTGLTEPDKSLILNFEGSVLLDPGFVSGANSDLTITEKACDQ